MHTSLTQTHSHTCTHTYARTHTGAVTSAIFSDPSQSPTVSGVQCTGSETDLLSCVHSDLIDSCDLNDDAGVVCQSEWTTFVIRETY